MRKDCVQSKRALRKYLKKILWPPVRLVSFLGNPSVSHFEGAVLSTMEHKQRHFHLMMII